MKTNNTAGPLPSRPFASLYVHVPFCRRKCDYCAFYSDTGTSEELQQRWLDQILAGARTRAAQAAPLRSLFVGGGTPTSLPAPMLTRLLQELRNLFSWHPEAEITVEANPDTLDPERIEALAAGGCNRLSLGVQSFFPKHRQTLGRLANPDQLGERLEQLRQHGIRRHSLDLIYAIPGQTPDDWRQDLRTALGLGISHLSAYALTLEEGTRLAAAGTAPADDELQVALWEIAAEEGARHGLRRYEISNYAKPGEECRHNLDIWLGGTYLGLGPAASSFDGALRWTETPDLQAWLAGTPPETDPLDAPQRAAEILAFGLRTCAGWNLQTFQNLTGFDALELRGEEIHALILQGFLELSEQTLRCTHTGLLFNDLVLRELL